jgi:hypothetical protein
MLLNSFGDNVDPGTFNQWLAANLPAVDFTFPDLPSFVGQSDGVPGPPVRFGSMRIVNGGQQAIINQLQQTIAKYGPVILDVPSEATGPDTYTPLHGHTHKLLAHDVVGQPGSQQVLIRDPGHVYASEPNSDVTLAGR